MVRQTGGRDTKQPIDKWMNVTLFNCSCVWCLFADQYTTPEVQKDCGNVPIHKDMEMALAGRNRELHISPAT